MRVQVDDQNVFVASGGREADPAKDTVVFVHGAGQDNSIWVLQRRYFARHDRNALAVDLPSHGRSGGRPLATIEQMAEWLVAVLDRLGIEQAAVVGHSMGSLVALEVAASFADRVRALAMVGTAVPMPVSDKLLAAAESDQPSAARMLTLWGHSSSAHLGGSPTPGMWMLGCGLRLMERSAEGVIHADLNACNRYENGIAQAAKVACPALLILGERDVMTPVRATRGLIDSLPSAELAILEGSGHALLSERPDEVTDALAQFC